MEWSKNISGQCKVLANYESSVKHHLLHIYKRVQIQVIKSILVKILTIRETLLLLKNNLMGHLFFLADAAYNHAQKYTTHLTPGSVWTLREDILITLAEVA